MEYIENPQQGLYAGDGAVINFVMKKYSVGGIAKADIVQTIRNNGQYGAASSLKYKKMTYGLSLAGSYKRDPDATSTADETFRDVYVNGTLYPEIHKTAYGVNETKADGVRAVFDAKYAVDNLTIAHSVSISNNRTPGIASRNSEIWTPNIFDTDRSETNLSNELLNIWVQGKCWWKKGDWVLKADWTYNHARESNNSDVAMGSRPAVVSHGRNNENSVYIDLTVWHRFNDMWALTLNSTTSIRRADTEYTGTSSQRDIENRYIFFNDLKLLGFFSRAFYMVITPGFMADVRKNKEMPSNTTFEPKGEVEVFWYPTDALSFYLDAKHYINAAGGVTSSTLIKVSDFMWQQGNPGLKSKPITWFFGNAVWMPFRNTSFSFDADYYQEKNRDYFDYFAAPSDLGGVIEKRRNAPLFRKVSFAASLQQLLIRRRLSLQVGARYQRWHSDGATFRNVDNLNYYGSAAYRVGNCSFGVDYSSPSKTITGGGYGVSRSPRGNLSFSFTYGTGDIFLSARMQNVLNAHNLDRWEFITPTYSLNRETLSAGRCLMLTLSYTIGYGLKVDNIPEVHGSAGVFNTEMLGIRR